MKEVFDDRGKPRATVLKNHFVQEGRIQEDVSIIAVSFVILYV